MQKEIIRAYFLIRVYEKLKQKEVVIFHFPLIDQHLWEIKHMPQVAVCFKVVTWIQMNTPAFLGGRTEIMSPGFSVLVSLLVRCLREMLIIYWGNIISYL